MISTRPDGRRFLRLVDVKPAHHVEWLRAATHGSTAALYLQCTGAEHKLVEAARQCGFVVETTAKVYRVPFAGIAHKQNRRGSPTGMLPADLVDADALFRLDERLRRDVPGLDGWIGRRDWFDQELASPAFDPAGYLVAQDPDAGRLMGLVRFWREPEMPKLGLLGVLPAFRNRFLSHELLMAGLAGASAWGHTHFETHTARLPLQRRMERLGAVQTGTFVQLVRWPEQ